MYRATAHDWGGEGHRDAVQRSGRHIHAAHLRRLEVANVARAFLDDRAGLLRNTFTKPLLALPHLCRGGPVLIFLDDADFHVQAGRLRTTEQQCRG